MSKENVELAWQVPSAWNDGGVNAVLQYLDADVEWRSPRESMEPGIYHGHDGVRAFAEEWLGAWKDFRVEPVAFIDAGDAVVAEVDDWGKGRTSGLEITDRWFYAYRLRAGKVVSWRPYADRAEALEAAGLVG